MNNEITNNIDLTGSIGNIHISDELKKKWINYEFRGKPFILKSGKYIRAYSKCFECIHFYDFEKDFIWFSKDDIMR